MCHGPTGGVYCDCLQTRGTGNFGITGSGLYVNKLDPFPQSCTRKGHLLQITILFPTR